MSLSVRGAILALGTATLAAAFQAEGQGARPQFLELQVRMETSFKGAGAPGMSDNTTVSSWADGRQVRERELIGATGVRVITREITDPVSRRFVAVNDSVKRYWAVETRASADQLAMSLLDPGENCLRTYAGTVRHAEVTGTGNILGYRTVEVEQAQPRGVLVLSLAPELGCALLQIDSDVSTQRAVFVSRIPAPNRLLVPHNYVKSTRREIWADKMRHIGVCEDDIGRYGAGQTSAEIDSASADLPDTFFVGEACPAGAAGRQLE